MKMNILQAGATAVRNKIPLQDLVLF